MVKELESSDKTVGEVKREVKKAPMIPTKIDLLPGGKQFSTLNRFLVQTEHPKVRGVPQGREDIQKSKKPKGNL